MHSADMPKKVLQTKADPNLALHEAQPSKCLRSYAHAPGLTPDLHSGLGEPWGLQ